MKHIWVVDTDRLQHYKKRNPPWIKSYRTEIKERRFIALNECERFQLHALRILASETDNWIPYDLDWLRTEMRVKKLQLSKLFKSKPPYILLLDEKPPKDAETGQEAWMLTVEAFRGVDNEFGSKIDPAKLLSERTLLCVRAIGGWQRFDSFKHGENAREFNVARSEFLRSWEQRKNKKGE